MAFSGLRIADALRVLCPCQTCWERWTSRPEARDDGIKRGKSLGKWGFPQIYVVFNIARWGGPR
jgi:hypothetical protein